MKTDSMGAATIGDSDTAEGATNELGRSGSGPGDAGRPGEGDRIPAGGNGEGAWCAALDNDGLAAGWADEWRTENGAGPLGYAALAARFGIEEAGKAGACGREVRVAQGADNWLAARVGRLTASRASEVVRGGRALIRDLLGERRTGVPSGADISHVRAVRRGITMEPMARDHYALVHMDREVRECGVMFCSDPWIAASPDGVVTDGEEGGLEIKCPGLVGHMAARDWIPEDHIPQVQMQMWVTGWRWVDFVSYYPGEEVTEMFEHRVPRDERYIAALKRGRDRIVEEVTRGGDDVANIFDGVEPPRFFEVE